MDTRACAQSALSSRLVTVQPHIYYRMPGISRATVSALYHTPYWEENEQCYNMPRSEPVKLIASNIAWISV